MSHREITGFSAGSLRVHWSTGRHRMEATMLIISLARDFSDTPGPRSRDEGDWSGEQFLDEILLPKFHEALTASQKLMVDLDGTEGYATSFLEASFGGLARTFDPASVLSIVEFKSEDEPHLIEEVKKYIRDAVTAK
jgi:hypothetical protein